MFMRVNAKCAHQVRPPLSCLRSAHVGRRLGGDKAEPVED